MTRRIGIVTAGGDAPGLNNCVKSLVSDAIDLGYEVVGIRKGWEGLLRFDPDNPATHSEQAMLLTKSRVRDIDRLPGSFLHVSRFIPDQVTPQGAPAWLLAQGGNGHGLDYTAKVQRAIERLGLEALVVLGNSEGLKYTSRLAATGVPLIGIPMTVENDVNGSQYALGFSTALASGYQHLHELRAMAASREEIAVVALFGRKYGLTTMLISVLAGADRVLIPEVPFDPERLAEHLLEDKRVMPANYAILAMSEAVAIEEAVAPRYEPIVCRDEANQQPPGTGPLRLSGQRQVGLGVGGSGAVVAEILERLIGQRVVFQPLNYLLRAGQPDGQDLLGAANFARLAADLLSTGHSGRLVVYQRGINYTHLPIEAVNQPDGKADMADLYDWAAYRAKPGILWAVRV